MSVLAAIGVLDFAIISLYQMGVLRRLPDLPGNVFDSNKVNASAKAYALRLPDGTTGTALYALTMMLASYGGSRRTGRRRWVDLALVAASGAGAIGAADYLRDMLFKQHKACPYCLVGAGLNFALLRLAWQELRS